MKTYTFYLAMSYVTVLGCLALLGWISLLRSVAVKKEIQKNII